MTCAATQHRMIQVCHCDERREEASPNCGGGDRCAGARDDRTGVISSALQLLPQLVLSRYLVIAGYDWDWASHSKPDFAILTLVVDAGCHPETLRCRLDVLALRLAEPTDLRLDSQGAACCMELRIERRVPKQDASLSRAPQNGVVVSSKH